MKRKLVIVEWVDAASYSSWSDESNLIASSGTLRITTAGFLVRKTKKVVTVALNYDEQGRLADAISIPANSITKITAVRIVTL